MPKAIGYARVSTEEQASSGLGLAAQRAAIEAEALRRGWELDGIYEDSAASGRRLEGRPGLGTALARLADRNVDVMIVSKLDRLSRSVKDFAHLLDLSSKQRWALVALDLGVDTSTPAGEAMAFVVGTFSQMERRLIGQRTKEALKQARDRGTKLGPPILVRPEIERYIVRRRTQGATLERIATELNARQVPTPRGRAEWRHPTVRAILNRLGAPTFPRGRRRRN